MNKMTKLVLALAPAFLMAACGGGDDSLDDRLDVADPKVRLVHAVPLGPNVSLFRDGVAQSVVDLPYKGASAYFDVSTSSATWSVRTTAAPNATIGESTFEATRGDKFTLVAVPGSGSLTEVLNIRDPYNKDLTSDNGRVRVLNAAINAPDIDVYITPPNADLAPLAPNFASVDYKTSFPASGEDSLDVANATTPYWMTITAAGSKTPLFRAPITVAENADWLVTVLPDSVAPNDVKVLVVASDDANPATEVPNTL